MSLGTGPAQGVGVPAWPEPGPLGVGVADGDDDALDDAEAVGDGAVPDGVADGELDTPGLLDRLVGVVLECGLAGWLRWPPPPTRLPTLVPVLCLPHTAASSGLPTDSSTMVITTMTLRNRPSTTPP